MKIKIKIHLNSEKCRVEAMKVAVSMPGIKSVAIEENTLIVVGDGVDSVALTVQLRKKVAPCEIIEVKNEKDENSDDESIEGGTKWSWKNHQYYNYHPPAYVPYQIVHREQCCIM